METVSSAGLFGLVVLIIAGVIFFGNNKSESRTSVQENTIPTATATTDTSPADQDTAQRAQDAKESTHAGLAVETPEVGPKEGQEPTAGDPTSTTETETHTSVVQEQCSESTQAENCSRTGAVQNSLF